MANLANLQQNNKKSTWVLLWSIQRLPELIFLSISGSEELGKRGKCGKLWKIYRHCGKIVKTGKMQKNCRNQFRNDRFSAWRKAPGRISLPPPQRPKMPLWAHFFWQKFGPQGGHIVESCLIIIIINNIFLWFCSVFNFSLTCFLTNQRQCLGGAPTEVFWMGQLSQKQRS